MKAENYSENLVSSFHSLGEETVKQQKTNGNFCRNNHETTSLKALANKVLMRNTARNNYETENKDLVSERIFHETEWGYCCFYFY